MTKTLFMALMFVAQLGFGQARWSAQKANDWYKKQPLLVGANFLPSTAINQLEMWQADTFDPVTIDRELGYAQGIGMNVMRVYLHNLLFEADAEGFFKRMDQFLAIADRRGIRIVFVLFDSCWNDDPQLGKQPDPKPGVHNSGWVRAPGSKRLFDSRTWAGLEGFVKGTLTRFGKDPRVLMWDLYNEPSNSGYHDAVMPLLTKTFAWAKTANPMQPLTAAWWHGHEVSNELMFKNSDVITFHNYMTPANLEEQIKELQARYKRPVICTEYMARRNNSTFEGCLPIFQKYKVGAINWGLVAGKSNTIYAWDTPMATGEEPALWFHDIFRPDGTPYKTDEVETIKGITMAKVGARP